MSDACTAEVGKAVLPQYFRVKNSLQVADERRVCAGLMTQITEDQKYGMIEAISHLIHRDYEAIVEDFVLLDFIPRGVSLRIRAWLLPDVCDPLEHTSRSS